MKNDGSWTAKPSGLKKGNLNAWRQMMFNARPEPEVDDIIVDTTTSGEIIGYLCTVADGYDSYWKRVAKPIDIPKMGGGQQQQQGGWGQPQLQQGNVFYTQRAQQQLGVSKQAQSQYNEPPMNFDDDIPF
ncbi:hypothetical protein VHP8226_00969 [Vibrio hippocampi]|uniref:Helix-destabilizing protein n=1 Tax=Vibrio hippocampi TaxID=654686 RepID=A0ABN8DEF3_9VIBR|nr:hypothetical protein VHP8226_00969 [Vibrio hippocampi]